MQYIDSLATTGTMLESVEELLNAPEQHHPKENVRLNDHTIELKHVTFAYEKDKGNVLTDVNLKITPGTKTALVGPSGGGKSTIAKLIARFFDVDGGKISIGGHDIRAYTLDARMRQISIVFQDVYLFHDTIAGNIAFGTPGATREQIMEAAKKACCHEFIMALPDGYDTMIGDGDGRLSGGERQRLSIARAILKDAPIKNSPGCGSDPGVKGWKDRSARNA